MSKIEDYKNIVESVRILRENKQTTKIYNTFDYCIFMITLMCFMVILCKFMPTSQNCMCDMQKKYMDNMNNMNSMNIPNGIHTIRNPIPRRISTEYYKPYNQRYVIKL